VHDRNEVHDVSILRFRKKTEVEMKKLVSRCIDNNLLQELQRMPRPRYQGDFSPYLEKRGQGLLINPLLAEGAVNFLRTFLDEVRDARVLEFGSGGSTVWTAQFTRNLISIEHSQEWFDKVQRALEEHGLCWPVDLRLHERPYHTVCKSFKDGQFDLVIVDGRDRVMCLKEAKRLVKPGGYMMLDDSQRPRYDEAFFCLRDWESFYAHSTERDTTWWRCPPDTS